MFSYFFWNACHSRISTSFALCFLNFWCVSMTSPAQSLPLKSWWRKRSSLKTIFRHSVTSTASLHVLCCAYIFRQFSSQGRQCFFLWKLLLLCGKFSGILFIYEPKYDHWFAWRFRSKWHDNVLWYFSVRSTNVPSASGLEPPHPSAMKGSKNTLPQCQYLGLRLIPQGTTCVSIRIMINSASFVSTQTFCITGSQFWINFKRFLPVKGLEEHFLCFDGFCYSNEIKKNVKRFDGFDLHFSYLSVLSFWVLVLSRTVFKVEEHWGWIKHGFWGIASIIDRNLKAFV